MAKLSSVNNTLASQMAPAWVFGLKYDKFYLAEHTMYGSSRLGIKKYWPYQYRYEWYRNKTVAENKTIMDSSDVSYRKPWYFNTWQSLVTANEMVPAGHPNTIPQYSSRITGQKQYEVSNHLGNVMAVVSDKVTEVKSNPSASLPTLALKRGGLNAAYDYYPFGMIMPERSVEDNSINCIPVSRTRMVNQVVYIDDYINSTDNIHVGPPVNISPGVNTTVDYDQVYDGNNNLVYRGVLENNQGLQLEGWLDLPAVTEGQTGVVIDGILEEDLIGDASEGSTDMKLFRVVDGQTTDELAFVNVMGSDSYTLTAEGLSEGDVVRVLLQYTASPAPPPPPPAQAPIPSSRMFKPKLTYSIITTVAQNYVALSCDTDGHFTDDYRYGFNGKGKDNEIGGKGNFLDFDERFLDTRLGRLGTKVDKKAKKFPSQSPYNSFNNNPIYFVDPDGNSGVAYEEKDKTGATIIVVRSSLYMYSDDMTMKQVQDYKSKIENDINNNWNSVTNDDGTVTTPTTMYEGSKVRLVFEVVCIPVTVQDAEAIAQQNNVNQDYSVNFLQLTCNPDYKFGGSTATPETNSGVYNVESNSYGTKSMAHEFGHFLNYLRKFLTSQIPDKNGKVDGNDNEHAGDSEFPSIMAYPPIRYKPGVTRTQVTGEGSKRKVLATDIKRLNNGKGIGAASFYRSPTLGGKKAANVGGKPTNKLFPNK